MSRFGLTVPKNPIPTSLVTDSAVLRLSDAQTASALPAVFRSAWSVPAPMAVGAADGSEPPEAEVGKLSGFTSTLALNGGASGLVEQTHPNWMFLQNA
jgi:hypothetical protein